MNKSPLLLTFFLGFSMLTSACSGPKEPQLRMRDMEIMTERDVDLSTPVLDGAIAGDAALPFDSTLDSSLATGDSALDMELPQDASYRSLCGTLSYNPQIERSGDWARGVEFQGQTEFSNGNEGSCGGRGSEALIEVELPENGVYTVRAQTNTGTIPVVYVRRSCDSGDTEIVCEANLTQTNEIIFDFDGQAGETAYIFIDTWQSAGRVEFTMNLTLAEQRVAPVASNATLSSFEGTLHLSFDAYDLNGDLTAGLLTTRSRTPELSIPFTINKRIASSQSHSVRVELDPLGIEWSSWTLNLLDARDDGSSPIELELLPTAIVQEGETCGLVENSMAQCASGLFCQVSEIEPRLCLRAHEPEIDSFSIIELETDFYISANLQDMDNDIVEILLSLYDDTGVIAQYVYPVEQSSMTHIFKQRIAKIHSASLRGAVLSVADALGMSTQSAQVSPSQPQRAALDQYCSLEAPELGCDTGLFCQGNCGVELGTCDGQCRPIVYPQITSATIVRSEDRSLLSTQITVSDPQHILSGLTLYTTTTASWEASLTFLEWLRAEDAILTSESTTPLSPQIRQTQGVKLQLETVYGPVVDDREFPISQPTTLTNGARCSPFKVFSECPEAHACLGDESDGYSCRPSRLPLLMGVELFENEMGDRGLALTGRSGDASLSELLFRRPSDSESILARIPIDMEVNQNESFVLRHRLPNQLSMTSFEVSVQDAHFQRSAWSSAVVTPSPELGLDDICPFDDLFGQCANGSLCLLQQDDTRRCTESLEQCDASWMVTTQNESPDLTYYNGDTRLGYGAVSGSCNLPNQGVIHGFRPTQSRRYTARVRPTGLSPINYPRLAVFEDCGDIETEVACTQQSALTFDGIVGEDVFLNVTAPPIADEFNGEYELQVTPHETATVESGTAASTQLPDVYTLYVNYNGGSETITSVALRVRDGAGQALWSPEFGELWTQSAATGTENGQSFVTLDVDLSSFEDGQPSVVEIRLIDRLDIRTSSVEIAIPSP